jgi:hypothetical protein
MDTITTAETEAEAVVTSQLHRIERRLRQLGVRVERKPIVRSGAGERYESEICVYFWRGNELLDALEFHIARGGVVVAQKADVESWLAEQLAHILEQV